ncbi:hypothetical protein SIID45300_02445 [Candidatus Magnetaquicoccaceae bacterium FCR-1]|uniref:Uncharacterized protein n=2 Tax=Candidatus Magnetaquiglobus chichijimensis TaxID=3141448 RepID=A0ABQ0CB48_9PROT
MCAVFLPHPNEAVREAPPMISPDRLLQHSLDWLGTTLNRITSPFSQASTHHTDDPTERRSSLWSLQSARLTLTRMVEGLADLLRRADQATLPEPQEQPSESAPLLYSVSGRVQPQLRLERSTVWTRPPARGGSWQEPAFRVELSPQSRLAGGAFTSVTAAPGEMDRFVERIRVERQAGFYPASVFEQARDILRKGEEMDEAQAMGQPVSR